MEQVSKVKSTLDRKSKEINETPESFAFFVLLHDFVKYVESTSLLDVFFGKVKKGSRASEISPKYLILKQVYQGIEDLDLHSKDDLGHDRYVAIRELSLIRDKNFSGTNSFWKRREILRKLTGEINLTLQTYLAELDAKN